MVWGRHVNIGAKLRVDPHERLWPPHATRHTEAQPVGLTGTVVRILSDDHYPRVFAPSELEGAEDLVVRRVDGIGKGRTLLLDKRREVFPVLVRELVLEQSTPVGPAQGVRLGTSMTRPQPRHGSILHQERDGTASQTTPRSEG